MKNSIKIATPISHLFENGKLSSQIISLSDCLECRDHSVDKDFKSQTILSLHNLKHGNYDNAHPSPNVTPGSKAWHLGFYAFKLMFG